MSEQFTPQQRRWPVEHDSLCESVFVDIGVGEMSSPCGCEVRWYQERVDALSAREMLREAQQQSAASEKREPIPAPLQTLADWFQLSIADFERKHPDKVHWSKERLLEWVEESL